MERSDTFRQQTGVNLATGAFDYREKAVISPSGVVTPQYVRFNQNSAVNHDEEFAELELRPFEGLKITPGIKRVAFERSIVAPYNQGTRYAQNVANTYGATLPFATVNYAVTPMLAVYGQFAKGFLVPPLSQLYIPNPSFSPASPQKSTNYQGGAVYHGSHLSLDADYYYIDFTNKFVSVLSPLAGVGNVSSSTSAGRSIAASRGRRPTPSTTASRCSAMLRATSPRPTTRRAAHADLERPSVDRGGGRAIQARPDQVLAHRQADRGPIRRRGRNPCFADRAVQHRDRRRELPVRSVARRRRGHRPVRFDQGRAYLGQPVFLPAGAFGAG
jgi:hypothetical protein